MKITALKIFTKNEQNAIHAAIHEAEKTTSAEIRVFIDDHCKKDPLEKAEIVFKKLKMHKTDLHSGVLIYLSVADQKFAILGDKNIHEKVQNNFWNETKELMLVHFKNNQITEGLIAGIKKVGASLMIHYPKKSNDHNELSDEIVFGNQKK